MIYANIRCHHKWQIIRYGNMYGLRSFITAILKYVITNISMFLCYWVYELYYKGVLFVRVEIIVSKLRLNSNSFFVFFFKNLLFYWKIFWWYVLIIFFRFIQTPSASAFACVFCLLVLVFELLCFFCLFVWENMNSISCTTISSWHYIS